jgi:hypothetical protein
MIFNRKVQLGRAGSKVYFRIAHAAAKVNTGRELRLIKKYIFSNIVS